MPELDPRLFELLNRQQHVGNQTPVAYGAGGMSTAEIESVEAELGFRLPEDFSYFLQNVQDPGAVLFPWADFRIEKYKEQVERVLGGIEFDVEQNGLWLERWSKRPNSLRKSISLVRDDFASWPRLLPIHNHRFLAAEPCRNGNPVFSIMQTDIIYYGSDLGNYLENEFIAGRAAHQVDFDRIRRIDIWSDLAEQQEPPIGLPRRS